MMKYKSVIFYAIHLHPIRILRQLFPHMIVSGCFSISSPLIFYHQEYSLQTSLTRTNYLSLDVDYAYDNGRGFTAYNTSFPGKFALHDVTVPTAAGVVAKIGIRKEKADGTFEEYTTDSIVCRENAANEKTVTL